MRDLSGEHWFSHLLLGMIVIGADVLIFQKREQFILMALQSLDKPWERAGQGLGLALVGPMIDNMVDSLTPMQCLRALYRLEVDGEKIFSDQIGGARREYRGSTYSAKQKEREKPEWRQHTETSPIDDSTNVYLWIEAEQPISGWLTNEVNPVLSIRCKENKTEAYINLKMRPKAEYGSYGAEYAYITLRFDDDRAFKEKFVISTDGEAIFFPKYIPYIKPMLKHKRLLVEFTPFNASPQITTGSLAAMECQRNSRQVHPFVRLPLARSSREPSSHRTSAPVRGRLC